MNWGNGGGWNDGTRAVYPDWLQIDFSSNQTISEIDVFTLQDTYAAPSEPTESMTFNVYGIRDFEVQYLNGSSWTTVPGGSVTGNNKVWRKFAFDPITTSKIRVLVNDALNNYSRIVEVEAWTAETGETGGSDEPPPDEIPPPEPPPTSTSAKIQWMVSDQLGTPRMIFDQTGRLTVTDQNGNYLSGMTRHDYFPFGDELSGGQPNQPGAGGRTIAEGYTSSDNIRQKFTSKERDDETGLDYFIARYYSSNHGRFTSPDEFTGGPDELFDFTEDAAENPTFYAELDNPQSLNKYQYTYNNPLNMTDDDGHCPPCVPIPSMPVDTELITNPSRALDKLQLKISGIGLVPGAGEIADVVKRRNFDSPRKHWRSRAGFGWGSRSSG